MRLKKKKKLNWVDEPFLFKVTMAQLFTETTHFPKGYLFRKNKVFIRKYFELQVFQFELFNLTCIIKLKLLCVFFPDAGFLFFFSGKPRLQSSLLREI